MRNVIENKGQFVISLDFELLWGVWDITTKEKYGANIVGVQQVIPRLLSLFDAFHIKATFATVGFLFHKDKASLLQSLPTELPSYKNPSFNVYQKEFPLIGENEKDDPYHFGYPLLNLLKNSWHEIGTHTYSHYYCLEEAKKPLNL
jgi:peptidoglycan/xylan/chitin deacetylase (PgdA/CDA1 family)